MGDHLNLRASMCWMQRARVRPSQRVGSWIVLITRSVLCRYSQPRAARSSSIMSFSTGAASPVTKSGGLGWPSHFFNAAPNCAHASSAWSTGPGQDAMSTVISRFFSPLILWSTTHAEEGFAFGGGADPFDGVAGVGPDAFAEVGALLQLEREMQPAVARLQHQVA